MLKFLIVSCALVFGAPSAFAEDTGWLNGSVIYSKSQELARQHVLVTKIECKDSGKAGLDLAAGIGRLTYETHPTKRADWYWIGTTEYRTTVADLESQGYKLVSKGGFVRKKTGVQVYCLLFQRPH